MAVVDHLVFAARDLASAVASFEAATGIGPEVGGAHPGLGTRNALVSLGESYLELIGPDPDQADPPGPRPFGIDDLVESGFVAFAIRPAAGESLEGLADAVRYAGFDPGPVIDMRRRRPDGVELSWRLTLPPTGPTPDVPFLIDWGETPNPSATVARRADIGELRVGTPRHSEIGALYAALGLSLPIRSSKRPALSASISGPNGNFGTRP